ncbi:MAG: phage tail assembly protein [Acinetobacter sp.]
MTKEQAQNQQVIENTNQRTVELETPIQRGDQAIITLVLNKPTVGTLRGLSLQSIAEFDVESITTLLTRITSPSINKAEIEKMEISDFSTLSNEVAYFLVSAKAKSQLAQTT